LFDFSEGKGKKYTFDFGQGDGGIVSTNKLSEIDKLLAASFLKSTSSGEPSARKPQAAKVA
jgi:hypothetical protein